MSSDSSSSLSSGDDQYFEDSSLSSGSSSDSGFSSSSRSQSSSEDDKSEFSSDDFTSSEGDSDRDAEPMSDGDDDDLEFEVKHARALKKWGVSTQDDKKAKTDKTKAKKTTRAEGGGRDVAAEQRESVVRKTWAEEVANFTEDEILNKIRELCAARHKRSGERQDQLRQAQAHAKEHGMSRAYVEALRSLISTSLDISASITLNAKQWRSLAEDTITLYSELCRNQELSSSGEGTPAAAVAGFVDCLNTNLNKGIKAYDSYSEEYRERIKLLPTLHAVLFLNHAYMSKSKSAMSLINRCLVALMSQTYYMSEKVAEARWKAVFEQIPQICLDVLSNHMCYKPGLSNHEWVKTTLKGVLLSNQDDIEVNFAGLCYYIQNSALNGHVDEAREIISSTPLYDIAQTLDVAEQVHYNRAIAQIGLAAFRQGNFQLASTFLNDICANNKQRELLAQGVSSANQGGNRGDAKAEKNEQMERKRLLPAYLHLNIDMIESASNIYSILNSRSLRFRRILDYTEKCFVPPETSREIVFACGRKLYNGDFNEACKLLKSLKFWQIYDEAETPGAAQEVQRRIMEKFKEIALICYFQRYSHVYTSFSAQDLAEMFELSKQEVYALVSRMILKKELNASWDASGEFLYIQQNLCTPLQTLTLTTLKNVDTLFEATAV